MAEVQVSNEDSLIEPIIKPSSSNGLIIEPSKEPQTENQETQKLPLSKNQLKKLNKLKYREENKEQRKQHLKEKKKEKKRKFQQGILSYFILFYFILFYKTLVCQKKIIITIKISKMNRGYSSSKKEDSKTNS